jgi:hypothetical protein
MKINSEKLKEALKTLSKQAKILAGKHPAGIYYTAKFWRAGRKQNGIEHGDDHSINQLIRAYVKNEEADTMQVDFYETDSEKALWSKKFFGLTDGAGESESKEIHIADSGSGFAGLGEAQVMQIVDKRVMEQRREDEFNRVNKELEALRSTHAELTAHRDELEESLAAKKNTEYYMGIIGTAFPGLSNLLKGTSLAPAAGFLAGTSDLQGNEIAQHIVTPAEEERNTISGMVAEFCKTLNPQEASAVHLLFMAFETDRAMIQRALQFITSQQQATHSSPSI